MNKKSVVPYGKVRVNNKDMFGRLLSFIIMIIFIAAGTLNKAALGNIKEDNAGNRLIQSVVESENKYLFVSAISEDNNKNTENGLIDCEEEIKQDTAYNQSESDRNEENNKIIGTSQKGNQYTYDAKKIFQKLKKGDYSNDGEKIVFLTFDDGASNTVTPKILDILKKYDVKATFFVVGQVIENGGEKAKNLVKQEFEEGHAIGNHSYTHDYNNLYPGGNLNLQQFIDDYNKNADVLRSILGEEFSTRVIRCPGGYMSWRNMSELDNYLQENDMATIDWNALSGDAEGKPKTANELVEYAIKTSSDYDIVVLLMHDTYGKEESVKALPDIIEYFKNKGYEFKTLS